MPRSSQHKQQPCCRRSRPGQSVTALQAAGQLAAGSLVEALWVVHAHFHRHALEELEGLAAQVGEAHAPQVHNPDGRAQGEGPWVQHLPDVLLHKPKVPVPHSTSHSQAVEKQPHVHLLFSVTGGAKGAR